MPLELIPTRIDGPLLLQPRGVRRRARLLLRDIPASAPGRLGINDGFVQDNHSRSGHGIVRGHALPGRRGRGQARALRPRRDRRRAGRPAPRLADLRRVGGLRAERREHAHALRARRLRPRLLRDRRVADVIYKQSSYYDPAIERAISLLDPDVAVAWPLPADELVLSERDATAPLLRDVATSCRSSSPAERANLWISDPLSGSDIQKLAGWPWRAPVRAPVPERGGWCRTR